MTALMDGKVMPRHQCQHNIRRRAWMSEESKQRMSKAHKGRKLSPEVRAKITAGRRGMQHSTAIKQKIRATQIAVAKAEAVAELNTDPPSCRFSDPRSRRPRFYWEHDDNMRIELEPHVIAVQHTPEEAPTRYLPTRKALLQNGLTALATAADSRGGMYSASIMKLMNAKVIPRSRRQYEQPGIKEGAKVTSRARHRMSEARKGKTLSAGVCAKMAASAQGKHHSEATKQKIGAGRRAVAQKKAAAIAEQESGAARTQAETAGGELGADKATGTKRNRRVRRSKAGSAMDDPDQEQSRLDHNCESKTKTEADVEHSQRKPRGQSTTLCRQEPLQPTGQSNSGADQERAQDLSKGKTRRWRAVGEAEMENIVAELTKLKRDLKQWRLDTEETYRRSLSEEEILERFPHVHKKMQKHTELQDFMRSLK